jgi:hypothetical protein
MDIGVVNRRRLYLYIYREETGNYCDNMERWSAWLESFKHTLAKGKTGRPTLNLLDRHYQYPIFLLLAMLLSPLTHSLTSTLFSNTTQETCF